MRQRLLAADQALLTRAFGDLLEDEPATHEVESLDPFTNTRRKVRVPVAQVDVDVILENSWELDSMTEAIECAMGCSADEADAQLELVREGSWWTLMSVSEAATRALTAASPAQLGGLAVELEAGQRLYLFSES